MRKKYLVRVKADESMIENILQPILRGKDRTTHKVTYKTSMGVVEYLSIPSGSNLGRYRDMGVSGALRKIFIWGRDNVEELEEMLRSKGVEMVEIVKDGPTTLELKT